MREDDPKRRALAVILRVQRSCPVEILHRFLVLLALRSAPTQPVVRLGGCGGIWILGQQLAESGSHFRVFLEGAKRERLLQKGQLDILAHRVVFQEQIKVGHRFGIGLHFLMGQPALQKRPGSQLVVGIFGEEFRVGADGSGRIARGSKRPCVFIKRGGSLGSSQPTDLQKRRVGRGRASIFIPLKQRLGFEKGNGGFLLRLGGGFQKIVGLGGKRRILQGIQREKALVENFGRSRRRMLCKQAIIRLAGLVLSTGLTQGRREDLENLGAGPDIKRLLGSRSGFENPFIVLGLVTQAKRFQERLGFGSGIGGFLSSGFEKEKGFGIRPGFLGKPRRLQSRTGRDIGRSGDFGKCLVSLQSGVGLAPAELECSQSHGGVFQIGIVRLLLKNGAIPILGGIQPTESVKAASLEIGGRETNAGFLRLPRCQLELHRGGFVELLSE